VSAAVQKQLTSKTTTGDRGKRMRRWTARRERSRGSADAVRWLKPYTLVTIGDPGSERERNFAPRCEPVPAVRQRSTSKLTSALRRELIRARLPSFVEIVARDFRPDISTPSWPSEMKSMPMDGSEAFTVSASIVEKRIT